MSGHDWRFPDRPHRGARAGRACRGMAQKKHVATAHTVGYLRGGAGYCSTLRIRRPARSGSGVGRDQCAHRTGNRGVASHPPGKNLTRAESAFRIRVALLLTSRSVFRRVREPWRNIRLIWRRPVPSGLVDCGQADLGVLCLAGRTDVRSPMTARCSLARSSPWLMSPSCLPWSCPAVALKAVFAHNI
jgi:hypothetical protein